MTSRDLHLLRKAHSEASLASWLFTAPNPRVGALALCEGHVIGHGFHAQFGGPHAEENALIDAGAWDATQNTPISGVVDEMVVTLEPCSSEGGEKQRPPCAQLLLAAGIQRLVVGAVDPDSRHQSTGLQALMSAGVEVVLLPEGQAFFEALNPAFLQALKRDHRPWTLLKWASSFDGKMATDSGQSQWLSSDQSREEVHQLRALPGAVLVGYGTLLQDNPALTARPSGEPLALQPLRVFLLPKGKVPPSSTAWNVPGPRLWILEEGQAPQGVLRELQNPEQDQFFFAPKNTSGKLALAPVLQHLREEKGIRRILVEGGSSTHASFLSEGIADSLVRYEAPLLLGGNNGALCCEGAEHPRHGIQLFSEERKAFGEDLRRAFLLQSPGFHSISE
ncbi:MAG: bifunctional diaminohydroxyphosphoribosylaminopyrimidine deaminase/5-amino-6-(5-phosphoribosylamino)uracil reductase RibD [Planctomycetota bacterium]|nr:bifunctional diaminohydroxyphosphoribosylaminopyrimidine deaminase/5-amino-6-(5-phosphoribosylamino)uracil reductase RibD [Planctomycetota bacterium]